MVSVYNSDRYRYVNNQKYFRAIPVFLLQLRLQRTNACACSERKNALQILDATRCIGKESGFCLERAQYHTGNNLKEQEQNKGGVV